MNHTQTKERVECKDVKTNTTFVSRSSQSGRSRVPQEGKQTRVRDQSKPSKSSFKFTAKRGEKEENQPPRQPRKNQGARKGHRHVAGDALTRAINDYKDQTGSANDTIKDLGREIELLQEDLDVALNGCVAPPPPKYVFITTSENVTIETVPAQSSGDGTEEAEVPPPEGLSAAHFEDSTPESFHWDECWHYTQFYGVGLFIVANILFSLLPLPWFITAPSLSWICWWSVSQLPKRHAVKPLRPVIDHTDDRRPDAHKMLAVSRLPEYYMWQKQSGPLPVYWLAQSCTNLYLTLLRGLDILDDVFSDFWGETLSEEISRITTFIALNVAELTRDLRIMTYSLKLFYRAFRSRLVDVALTIAAMSFLSYYGMPVIMSFPSSIVIFALIKYIKLVLCTIRVSEILVSNNMVKQLSSFRCCDPFAEPSLTRERICNTARTICSVNFDQSTVMQSQRIVDNSTLVAFYMSQDAIRRNMGFRVAL